jgi:hypothetical protein
LRLILRDFLASLQERKELDRVIVDLLVAMGLRVVRLPSHGIAERGLDIAAVGRIDNGPRTLYLIQVKQGDITRADWNKGLNSVRASLDDLVDFAKEALDLAGRPAPRRTALVLAHNGMVKPNVEAPFHAHRKAIRRQSRLQVEHWHIHTLVEMFETHLFDEHCFSVDQASFVQKTLAFIEVPEYDLRHFREFLSATIPAGSVTGRAAERRLLQIQVALAMVYQYGTVEGGNHDVTIRAFEASLLKVYGWMYRSNLFSETKLMEQLARMIDTYLVVSIEYLAKLDPFLDVYHGLARTGLHETVEYPLRALKVGALAGQWVIFLGRMATDGQLPDEMKPLGEFISNFLVRLQTSCPPVERPLFDYQMADVCLFAIGLRVIGRSSLVGDYLNSVISRLYLENQNGKPLPEGAGDFEAVSKLLMTNKVVEWYSTSSSTLLSMLSEICTLLDLKPLYELIRNTWQGKVDFQNVYLNGRFVEWACDGGHSTAADDERNESGIFLPPKMEDFRAEIDRKRSLDSSFANLFNLPFFELIMHVTSRANRIRFSPAVWRAFRTPSSPEMRGDDRIEPQ